MAVENSISLADAPQSNYMDDSSIKRKRILAQQLMLAGADISPIRSPWQGAARLAQGLMGGIHEASADAAEKENNDYNANLMQGLLTPSASASGNVSPAPSPAALTPSNPAAQGVASTAPEGINNAILTAADKYGIPHNVAFAMARQESTNNPNAPHGGLFQITQGTAAKPGYGMQPVNYASLSDPATNADFGMHYLAARNPGINWNDPAQVDKALTSYNGGGDPNYVQHVRRFMPQGGSNAVEGPALGNGGGAPVKVASNDAAGSFGASAPSAQNGQAQRILAAMADPRLSAQNKQILALMYKQAVGNDGTHRHVVNGALVDDSGKVLYQAPEKSKSPGRHVVGGAMVDDEGNILYQAPEKPVAEKSTLASQAREREALADQYGLKGEDRNNFVLTGKIPTTAEKAPTGEQANAANFATRMREADKIITDPSLMDAVTLGQKAYDNIPLVGNFLTSDHFKQMDQAQRDFVNATLRRESGASISQPEFENAKRQYFPQPGDTPTVIEQKAKNRATAMEGIANAGTPSFREQFFGERSPNVVKRADERAASSPALDEARAAIANGAPREAVIRRLQEHGINPAGL